MNLGGRVPAKEAVSYIVAQEVGAIIVGGTLYAVASASLGIVSSL